MDTVERKLWDDKLSPASIEIAQGFFDKALAGLRAQGRRSLTPDGTYCLYRSPEGHKCAVGFLIPDELYSTEMEPMSPYAPLILEALGIQGTPPQGIKRFLRRLQGWHDNLPDTASPTLFQRVLEDTARNNATVWGLNYSPPKEVW